MKKIVLLIAAFLLFSVNNASALWFDTNGAAAGGNLVDITQWDWGVGSAASMGGNDPASGQVFTLLTHATLSGINNGADTSLLDPSKQITFVAGFEEQVYDVSVKDTLIDGNLDGLYDEGEASFQLAAPTTNSINFFEIYIDDTFDADEDLAGDTSAGTGFNGDGTGTLILRGTVTSSLGSFKSHFDVVPSPTTPGATVSAIQALDQFGDDEMPGQLTVSGQGSTNLWAAIGVTYLNTDYFKYTNLIVENTIYLNSTTNSTLPFLQVDPSNNYWNGSAYVNPNIGAINGAVAQPGQTTPLGGPDVIFQTDVSTSGTATYVPEPTTMMLFGIGLLGFAGIVRRKNV